MIAGADWGGTGWVTVFERPDGSRSLELIPAFETLLTNSDLKVVVIDVPIGLTDYGPRGCDIAARKFLGPPRASSVFPPPIRPMLEATTYTEACEKRFAVEGKRCSQQLFAIMPLIRDVDALISPGLQARVFEGHPEVSFAMMAGGPLRFNKKREPGKTERRNRLLQNDFGDVPVGRIRGMKLDDIHDAYAMLWTARRIVRGEYRDFAPRVEHDRRELRMRIVA